MKYLVPVVCIILLFANCGDEETRRCWDCTITYSGSMPDSVGDSVFCTYSKTDIELRSNKKFASPDTHWDAWEISNCKGL